MPASSTVDPTRILATKQLPGVTTCTCGVAAAAARASLRHRRLWIGCGRRARDGSISTTRSGSSSETSAGLLQSSMPGPPGQAEFGHPSLRVHDEATLLGLLQTISTVVFNQAPAQSTNRLVNP